MPSTIRSVRVSSGLLRLPLSAAVPSLELRTQLFQQAGAAWRAGNLSVPMESMVIEKANLKEICGSVVELVFGLVGY